jgi:Tol biopolymer transport system component
MKMWQMPSLARTTSNVRAAWHRGRRVLPAALIASLLPLAAPVAATPFPVERDPGGCRLERVAGAAGENHVLFRGLSPDGRTLGVGWDRERGGATERGAYLLDLRTGRRRDLTGLNNAPSFSPDGRRLVAANYPGPPNLRMEIVELDLASGTVRSLASDPASEWLPSFSRDGRWVVFNSTRSGGSDLYRVDTRTGAVERLTDDPRYEAHAQFSRDGRHILFHRQISGDDYGLAMLDLATRKVVELPGTPREEAYPAFSPDERRIAYSSDAGQEAGKPDLYVMRADGSRPRRLTAHPDKDAYATWSPNGRHIYFTRQGSDSVRIYRLEMRGGDCRRD